MKIAKAFAVVFPGQGSQTVGMLNALASSHSLVQKTFAEASHILAYDLWELVSVGPDTQLNQTEYTQPALVAAGVAVWRIWLNEIGIRPKVLAGHSLGEYTALVCSEAISFHDALLLARIRGRLMQSAVLPEVGAMAAIIGLNDCLVETLCLEACDSETRVTPANYNADGQLVIAGHALAVDRAIARAKTAGAKMAKRLNVSVPSHCDLMQPISAELAAALARITINPPQIPVIQNVEASIADSPDTIRAMLVRQVYQPVRWTATLRKLAALNCELSIECGPGKVLTGLAKRTTPLLPCLPIFDTVTFDAAASIVRQLT